MQTNNYQETRILSIYLFYACLGGVPLWKEMQETIFLQLCFFNKTQKEKLGLLSKMCKAKSSMYNKSRVLFIEVPL